MNALDAAILAVAVTASVGGYRLGLVTGATSWVFLLQGLVVAGLATPVVAAVGGDVAGVRLGLGLGLFLAGALAGYFLGRRAGDVFRETLVRPEWSHADKVAGAAVGPMTVFAAVWLVVLPPLAGAPGWPSRLAEGSAVARSIDGVLPDATASSRALRRLTESVAMPEVLVALGPAGDSSPPPRRSPLSPGVSERVSASTVKVEGEACFFEQYGSGFAVDHDLIVTNAHVVAGQRETTVLRADGVRLSASVAVFDPDRDLALLRVDDLDQVPLPLEDAREGSLGAVFGHPEGQDKVEVSPAAVRQELVATVRSVDEARISRRNLYVLAAHLEPGDSGGALVTPTGGVAGVAFAVSRDRAGVAFALTVDELRPLLAADRTGTADTGPCL